MKVIERGSTWFLYAEDDSFFLGALCSHGAADYMFELALNSEEIDNYKLSGSAYLDKLAYGIHYSAPGVIGSKSPYISRRLSSEYADKLNLARVEWRNK